MIYKVILKNFKSNLRNYLLFFFSEVLSMAMIFSIFAIKDILWSWLMDEALGSYLLQYLVLSVVAIVGINVFLMTFSVRYYVKTRLKDYGLFLIFGMRKKMIICSLLAEFGLGWLGSVALGGSIGYGISAIFKYIVARFYSKSVYSFSITLKAFQYSLMISAVIMALSVVVILVLIEEKGIGGLIATSDRKEQRMKGKWQFIGLIFGIGLFIFSMLRFGMASYSGLNASGEVTLIECSIAMFLLLTFGGNIVLELFKRRQLFYYKKLLNLNQFYHRYNSNIKIIFLLFVIQMFSLGDLAVQITDNMPVAPKDEWYPYDYVWFARREDDKFAKELTDKYGGQKMELPVIRVTVTPGEQHFGISQDIYQTLTGDHIDLTRKEVLFISQGRPREVAPVEQDMGSEKAYYALYYGKRTDKLEFELHPEGLECFSRDYVVKEIKRDAVFGYLGDGWSDNVYVFSNEFFDEKWNIVSKDKEEPDWLILINLAKKNQIAFSKELNNYVKKNGIKNTPKFGGEKILYEIPLIKAQKKAENILKITINLFVMALLYIGSIFIMGMKMYSDLDIFQRKYEFLNSLGMCRKKMKKSIGKEILSVLNLPLILSYISCTIFICRLFFVRGMGGSEIVDFMKCYGLIVLVYLVMQIFSAWCMKKYLIRKVEEVL